MKKILLGIVFLFIITGCEVTAEKNNNQNSNENNNEINNIQDNTSNNNEADKEQTDTDKKDDSNNSKENDDNQDDYEEVTPERVENLFSIEKKVNGTNHVVKFIGFGDVYDNNETAEIYANILLDGKEILTQVDVGEYAWPFNKDEFKVELSSVHGNIMLGINLDRIGDMNLMNQPGMLLVIDYTGKILINETELYVDYSDVDYSDDKRIEPIVVDNNSITLNIANGGRRKYTLNNGTYVKTSLEAPDNWIPCCGY